MLGLMTIHSAGFTLRRFITIGCAIALAGGAASGQSGGLATHELLDQHSAGLALAPQAGDSQIEFLARVLDESGSPVRGAVVVTAAGGEGVSDAAGAVRIPVALNASATSLGVTAAATIGGVNHIGSALVRTQSDVDGAIDAGEIIVRAGGECEPQWLPTFGHQPGFDSTVNAVIVFDDGSGPALYAAGWFTTAEGLPVDRIARWDGENWSPLGSGVNDGVTVLAVFDDGSGPALYAGGWFTTAGDQNANHIARWDGNSWSSLDSGMNAPVRALAVFDDGSGLALYAGGGFTTAGGQTVDHIARWDGQTWSSLASGTNASVNALTVFDDGSGPALYAGGGFTTAGGESVNHIARWDGQGWSPLGAGISGVLFTAVRALTVFDDGSGPALYAGGTFTHAGGQPALHLARWDGENWSSPGDVIGSSPNSPAVYCLTVFDDGSGSALYVGGDFHSAGGISANNIARWDGESWSSLKIGVSFYFSFSQAVVLSLAVYDDGSGAALYATGGFTNAGPHRVDYFARWDGENWSPVGSGLNDALEALTVFDDGSGPALYAGGRFTAVGGQLVNHIARWDGEHWSPLGSGVSDGAFPSVSALTVFDDGTGPSLYAGGIFTSAGGQPAKLIARWDGENWSSLGSGDSDPFGSFQPVAVYALTVFDDGAGPSLYAGGRFFGANSANSVVRWNGQKWSNLGLGILGAAPRVDAMTVFDDGSGPALYVGGEFTSAGGQPANRVARWNGQIWSPLGSGVNDAVHALAVFDDGSGPALYAGGEFTTAGGQPVNRIARWDGQSWSSLGDGVSGMVTTTRVSALTVLNDGTGRALYAGGRFATAGDIEANNIARWNGENWSPVGSGMSGGINALTSFDAGSGMALYAGGIFTNIATDDSYLARWQGCPIDPDIPGDLNGDGAVDAADLSIFLGSWGACPPEPAACPADFNGDGVVNAQDLGILLGNWGI